MSNLPRFDPRSLDPVSDLFQGFFRPMRSMLTTQDAELASMKIDVTENDGGYSVKAVRVSTRTILMFRSTAALSRSTRRSNETRKRRRASV